MIVVSKNDQAIIPLLLCVDTKQINNLARELPPEVAAPPADQPPPAVAVLAIANQNSIHEP